MTNPRHAMECEFYDGLTTANPTVEGPARPRSRDGMQARKRALREGRLIPTHEAVRLAALKEAQEPAIVLEEAAPEPEAEPDAPPADEPQDDPPAPDDGSDLLE